MEGLEPSTSCIQNRPSIQLTIHPVKWSEWWDSNSRPSAPKADALARLRYTPMLRLELKTFESSTDSEEVPDYSREDSSENTKEDIRAINNGIRMIFDELHCHLILHLFGSAPVNDYWFAIVIHNSRMCIWNACAFPLIESPSNLEFDCRRFGFQCLLRMVCMGREQNHRLRESTFRSAPFPYRTFAYL